MERLSSCNCPKIKFCDFFFERPTSTSEQKSAGAISENIQIRGLKKSLFHQLDLVERRYKM